jgi:hypothetical protein
MLVWEKRLNRAKSAASKRGFLANLTLDDWNQTCADTENRCVYCEKTLAWEDASIDHFYPMALGAGQPLIIASCVVLRVISARVKLAQTSFCSITRRDSPGFGSIWPIVSQGRVLVTSGRFQYRKEVR